METAHTCGRNDSFLPSDATQAREATMKSIHCYMITTASKLSYKRMEMFFKVSSPEGFLTLTILESTAANVLLLTSYSYKLRFRDHIVYIIYTCILLEIYVLAGGRLI